MNLKSCCSLINTIKNKKASHRIGEAARSTAHVQMVTSATVSTPCASRERARETECEHGHGKGGGCGAGSLWTSSPDFFCYFGEIRMAIREDLGERREESHWVRRKDTRVIWGWDLERWWRMTQGLGFLGCLTQASYPWWTTRERPSLRRIGVGQLWGGRVGLARIT